MNFSDNNKQLTVTPAKMDENTTHHDSRKVSVQIKHSPTKLPSPPETTSHIATAASSRQKLTIQSSKLKHLMKNKTHAPQVWARIRPPPTFQDNVFKVDETGKRLCVKLDDPSNKNNLHHFPTDGILYNSSQDETFTLVAHDLVQKAFDGVSSLFIALGSELTGKNFTLFGTPGKYDHRGLIPRTIDHIFDTLEKIISEKFYQVFISGVQIHQNHIRDMVTMTPYNIDCIGLDGPCQKMMHEVYNREEAGAILHRIFAEKAKLKKKSPEKFHTFIYFDIYSVNLLEKAPVQKSRITFVKIASIPTRQNLFKTFANKSTADGECIDTTGCPCCPNKGRSVSKTDVEKPPLPFVMGGKCCHRKEKLSACISTEDNDSDLRRDLFFLEQLFARSNLLRKMHLMKLKRPDLLATHFSNLHIAPSQYFRQCKLTHCLKDMSMGNTEIRIIIHVRPEAIHINATMDTLNFAKRAKGIPIIPKYRKNQNRKHTGRFHKGTSSENHISIEESILNTLLHDQPGSLTIQLNPHHVKLIGQQVNKYFTGKLGQEKVSEKPLERRCEKKPPLKVVSIEPSTVEIEKASQSHYKVPVTDNLGATNSFSSNSMAQFITLKQIEEKEQKLKEAENKEKTVESPAVQERKPSITNKSKSGIEKVVKEKEITNSGTEETEVVTELVPEEDKNKTETEKIFIVDEKPKPPSHNKKARKGKDGHKNSKTDSKKKPDSNKKERRKSLSVADKVKTAKIGSQEKRSPTSSVNNIVTIETSPADAKIKQKKKKQSRARLEEDGPLTVKDAWNSFILNSAGRKIFTTIQQNVESTCKLSHEKNNIKKYAANLRKKIDSVQLEIENYKNRVSKSKKRSINDKNKNTEISEFEKKRLYDIKIMQLSRDPLLVRLHNMKIQFKIHKHDLEVDKKSCESVFQIYAKENFGLIVSVKDIPLHVPDFKLESVTNIQKSKAKAESLTNIGSKADQETSEGKMTAAGGLLSHPASATKRRTRSLPDDLIHSTNSKQYEDISHVGRIQARFLRKINQYRPQWVKYY